MKVMLNHQFSISTGRSTSLRLRNTLAAQTDGCLGKGAVTDSNTRIIRAHVDRCRARSVPLFLVPFVAEIDRERLPARSVTRSKV